ncbi:MAG: DNA-deoxyinosine glycosylase [Novosphingobium sp.]
MIDRKNGPERKSGIAPIIPHDARLLILGSLPGDASLAAERYYAHPRNLFWRLLGGVLGRDLAAMDYADRLAVLANARIGLWDVVASAQRPGSLDTAMRAVEANPLAECVAGLPDLRAVAFNGASAARIGHRALAERRDLALIDLPSSSPAHAAMTYPEKAASWSVLAYCLDPQTLLAATSPDR